MRVWRSVGTHLLENDSETWRGTQQGTGTVLWVLRGELLGLPFTSTQNKTTSCQKLAFPQPRGRPRSPATASSSPRPRSPGLQPPLPQVPKESGPQHPALGSQVPSAGLSAAPLPPGGASESPTPMACQVGKRSSPSKALGAGRGVPTQPPSVLARPLLAARGATSTAH